MPQTLHNPVPGNAVEGVVDGFTDNVLRGWACRTDDPSTTLRIEAWAGDQLLHSADASVFRADLAAAGKGLGHCGFAITFGTMTKPGTALTVIAVVPDGQQYALPGSPTIVPTFLSRSVADPDVLPIPFHTADLRGSLDQYGPHGIRGWAYWLDDTSRPITLMLCELEHEWLRFSANQWRDDLAEMRQGDGCCGFEALLPAEICDGQLHTLDLRRSDTGASVLARPFRARIGAQGDNQQAKPRMPAPLQRSSLSRKVTLSIIVNFYNMKREAERTLTSLSRSYQRDADGFDYEVLCIDNGSNPPLDPAWVESFGSQFRLIRPSRQLASPCTAINEAALQAQGQYLAIMIDGAHVLTPGIFREARQAWCEHPDAVIAVRHWFIGGDQRWLTVAGYSREMEDRLFERIQWPNNGYELFRISAPIGESPEPWLDPMSESNCLMLPTVLYDRIGGMDEAFEVAGGGFANLDLWRRTSDSSTGPLISLIGEASFHQFHGGTTTNVDDAEKDLRVRAYANAYRTLRGADLDSVPRSRLQFRGRLQSSFALGIRQRSLLPLRLGVTDKVRPGQLSLHFDEGAQTYLQSVYAECGLHENVTWLGQPTGLAPSDVVNIQMIIHQLSPDAVIMVGVEAGLTCLVDTALNAIARAEARILCINPASAATYYPQRSTIYRGSPDDPRILSMAHHWTGTAETVLILYSADPAQHFSLAALQAYGKLVSCRSYLICLGTVFGQPWLGYSNRQPLKIIREFTDTNASFAVDRSWNKQLISTCPSGYLRKIGPIASANQYDHSLDEFINHQGA